VLVTGPGAPMTITVSDRVISGFIPPGTYSIRIQATNQCGVSTATAARQVIVR
jgi:hypothetical protein